MKVMPSILSCAGVARNCKTVSLTVSCKVRKVSKREPVSLPNPTWYYPN